MTTPIALTGLQPTGLPHLGNLYGAMLPAKRLAANHRLAVFIADVHALNGADPATVREATDQLARLLIALGLDEGGAVYRQSDVPETFELALLLANVAGKGLLNRSHAYRAAVERNQELGRPEDDGVNVGLYLYPLLMAADILVGRAEVVPVGHDQKSHVELARDLAGAFNSRYGEAFTVPEPVISEAAIVPGTDGRKMSKSYGNVLPLLASDADLAALVRRIPTTSLPPEAPKDPDSCGLYQLYRLGAGDEEEAAVRARYLEGGLAYGEMKQLLASQLADTVGALRDRALALTPERVAETLASGAAQMRATAAPLLADVRERMGLGQMA